MNRKAGALIFVVLIVVVLVALIVLVTNTSSQFLVKSLFVMILLGGLPHN